MRKRDDLDGAERKGRPPNLTPFGRVLYDILESRGVDTGSQKTVAEGLKALGYPNPRLSQQSISNWTTYGEDRPKRPPSYFHPWLREALDLSKEERESLGEAYLFETDWGQEEGPSAREEPPRLARED